MATALRSTSGAQTDVGASLVVSRALSAAALANAANCSTLVFTNAHQTIRAYLLGATQLAAVQRHFVLVRRAKDQQRCCQLSRQSRHTPNILQAPEQKQQTSERGISVCSNQLFSPKL